MERRKQTEFVCAYYFIKWLLLNVFLSRHGSFLPHARWHANCYRKQKTKTKKKIRMRINSLSSYVEKNV